MVNNSLFGPGRPRRRVHEQVRNVAPDAAGAADSPDEATAESAATMGQRAGGGGSSTPPISLFSVAIDAGTLL